MRPHATWRLAKVALFWGILLCFPFLYFPEPGLRMLVHSFLSITVLTLWVAQPKMFYNWYRIWWSRNQLWICTHFRHPTDEQLRQLDIYRSRTSDRGLSSLNWVCRYWRAIRLKNPEWRSGIRRNGTYTQKQTVNMVDLQRPRRLKVIPWYFIAHPYCARF